jgi:hypothetical protein
MVKVSIQDSRVIFDVQGLHKVWAFKNRLEIPLAHIKRVHADPNIARAGWKGVRMPGTHLPGVIVAGTFYRGKKRSFWDVSRSERAIVVELADERYDELVIEVDNPSAEVERLESRVTATRESI